MLKKLIPVALTAALLASAARAEIAIEAIPKDYIEQFAPLAVELFKGQFPNPPVKVEPDALKALGYHVKEQFGAIVFPDKNVTAKLIDEVGDKEVPVAIFSTLSLTLESGDKAVPAGDLAVADFNGQLKLPVFFLAVKAQGADKVMSIYSKDGKALGTTVLKKQAGDAGVMVGLKLSNIDEANKKVDATFSFGGTYEATLKLAYLKL